MRRLITWSFLAVILFAGLGCKQEIRDDETPTTSKSQDHESDDAPSDALAAAEAWIDSSERDGLNAETKPIAEAWKAAPVVLRVFRDGGSYFALVGSDTSDRVVPAVLLKLDENADSWSVTQTEAAASDLLWPSI